MQKKHFNFFLLFAIEMENLMEKGLGTLEIKGSFFLAIFINYI